jgi:ribose 5-phosphate isomerase A
MSFDIDPEKFAAARAAAAVIEPNMTVGLGSGSTANLFIEALGERVRRENLPIVGVPTSVASADLARSLGIALEDLDAVPSLDIDIDGADEVDGQFRMVKGRGGALLHEKIVAAAARRRVILVSPKKRVKQLGVNGMPIPLEVSSFGLRHTIDRVSKLGATPTLRQNPDGSPFITDEGHRILDCRFAAIDDPGRLDTELQSVVGVFETGIFLGLCDELIVGHPDGTVEHVVRPPV